ncbi:MAG: hypothetical protein SVU69_10315 [Pseudomonadota bacterium]|nr:hypothetical protein [Pseudomonadota bacterium]
MRTLNDYPLRELKVIYQVLQLGIQTYPEVLDSVLHQDLFDYLRLQALKEGVDPSMPDEWQQWLGNMDPTAMA